jgi:hypothetical protein
MHHHQLVFGMSAKGNNQNLIQQREINPFKTIKE